MTHVLVVEDDPALRRSLTLNLTVRGYTVDDTGNGEDALRLAGRRLPDVLFLDLGLPGMSGLDVIDHGPGLSDVQRESAFRPFHRFEDRGASSGIGLGLPICAGFCEAMGAALDLDSTPGGGLTARVVLEPTP